LISGIHKISIFILLLISILPVTNVSAQETMVVGQVLNKIDQSPIEQVNISFKNTNIVVQSNNEGYFLIKTAGNETTLVFSCIGFKRQEVKIKRGQSVGMDVQLEEDNTLLQEVFVIPGANPAMDLMKKVRLQRKQNDLNHKTGFNAKSTEQNLVLLSKINQRAISKRVFDQLKTGDISTTDSSLVIPVYMAENKYKLTDKQKKELSKNIFSSPENGEKILEKLVGEMSTELNFYDNTVTVFGKSMVSPLASVGNAYYDYYLADSTRCGYEKQYEIHFRTKNVKNLAFNGKFWIDSASLALTKIEAELPYQANINFIHNLRISENFVRQLNNYWARMSEKVTLNMNYELMADSLHSKPEIFVKRSAAYQYNDSIFNQTNNFAQSEYTQESLDEKLKDLNNTPLLRTAKWIADAIFTGYMQVGKIDIGKVQQIVRITDIEGFRLNLPLRTNEKLWKNISLGGSLGYGFKNEAIKYSGLAQFKIPGNGRKMLSLNYTNDYRRIDYNYNDFLYRENPLITGDEDISSIVSTSRLVGKMSERKEFGISFANDWNSNIESSISLRFNTLLANSAMPMLLNGTQFASFLQQQSATFITRFSFNEKKIDDHTQRIYIDNNKPVIYGIFEVGKYNLGNKSGNYGKLLAKMKHIVRFDLGELYYIAEMGFVLGRLPYPLLEIPEGGDSGGYGIYQFNLMNDLEYATDKYVDLHSDFTLNGLIMNQIPIIKNLNLREICSFNIAYGGLSNSHKAILDYPGYTNPLSKPYMEVGVGLSNILHIFTLQSIWRLTDLNHKGAVPWGLRGCLRLSF